MSEVGPQDRAMCYWPEIQVLEGVHECLEALTGNYTLCIATNATISRHNEIKLALNRGHIGKYFELIFCHTDLGFRKNQPEFWEAVAEKLGHPLCQVAMIGDSLEHDALAPARFGVKSYWLNPAGTYVPPDGTIRQVRNLGEFAAELRNAA